MTHTEKLRLSRPVALTLFAAILGFHTSAFAAPSEALLQDAAAYAQRYAVSKEEAVRRLQLQGSLGAIEEMLAQETGATFAGLWIEHEPTFRLVLAFTDGVVPRRLLPELSAIKGGVEVRTARFSLEELSKQQASAREVAAALGFSVDSDVNVHQNRVELYVVEDRQSSGLRRAERALPPGVLLVPVEQLARPLQAAQLEGGTSLTTCTAGFTVRNSSGEIGVSTAAHCGNTQSALGVTLSFRSEDQEGNQDVQWHPACGLLDVSNNFNSGIGTRACTGTRHRDNQVIGSFVCKWGMTSGRTCGNIESKSYSPSYVTNSASTFIRVDGGSTDLVSPGDSGGPWFVESIAYGITSGEPGSDPNDALYMPINYLSSLSVYVLTSDPPGPACNLCSPTLCGSGRPPCCAGACVPSGLGGLRICQ